MATQQTYCPVCAAPIGPSAKNCPRCKANIDEWDKRNFVEKLIEALRHPLSEVRMRAIIVLGNRRERAAEQALADCAFAHPNDVVQGLEIVDSLRRICEGHAPSLILERLAREHPARAVRKAAGRALKKR